jgi:hypothetical protein
VGREVGRVDEQIARAHPALLQRHDHVGAGVTLGVQPEIVRALCPPA